MRIDNKLEEYRITKDNKYASPHGANYGAFDLPGPCGMRLLILATAGYEEEGVPGAEDWEHVSISGRRTPNWDEMCFARKLFWDDEDWVFQFHPPLSEYVTHHPHCLHLWRYKGRFPTPPSILVGPKDKEKT